MEKKTANASHRRRHVSRVFPPYLCRRLRRYTWTYFDLFGISLYTVLGTKVVLKSGTCIRPINSTMAVRCAFSISRWNLDRVWNSMLESTRTMIRTRTPTRTCTSCALIDVLLMIYRIRKTKKKTSKEERWTRRNSIVPYYQVYVVILLFYLSM